MRTLALLVALSSAQAATSFIATGKGAASFTAATNIFGGVWAGSNGISSTVPTSESSVIFPIALAGTFCKLQVNVIANDRTSSNVAAFRIGTGSYATPSMADGTQVLTIAGGGGAALVVDNTHCDHVAAGNFISIRFNSGTGGTTFAVNWYSVVFTPDDITKTWTKMGAYSSNVFSSPGGVIQPVAGGWNTVRSETDIQFQFRDAGTWSNLCVNVSNNTFTNSGSIQSRIGAVNASQTGTITANTGSTATESCATGTDSVAIDAKASWTFTNTSSGSGTMTVEAYASDYVTTDNNIPWIVQGVGTFGGTPSQTIYLVPHGNPASTTTQGANARNPVSTVTLSHLGLYVISNSLSSTAIFEIWKNNASTGVTITFNSGVTGWLYDDTHSIACVSGDLIEIRGVLAAGGTSIALTTITMEATMPATAGSGRVPHRVIGE